MSEKRWSIFATGVEHRLVAGILASSYGGTYVVLLERGGQHSLFDLVAFACFAGVGLTGACNLLGGLASLRDARSMALCLAITLCGIGWVYTSLIDTQGIAGGEAAFYGVAAATAFAAWIDAHRSGSLSLWSVTGPVALFVVWSLGQALEANSVYGYAATIVSVMSLIGVRLLRRT